MKILPIIETERLILRSLSIADAQSIYDYFSQDQVMRYYDLETFTSLLEAEELIQKWNLRFQNNQGCRWGITMKQDSRNKVIGTCGFHNLSIGNNRAEIGYEIHPQYWNLGFASEGCKALIEYGFKHLCYHRIEAYIDPQHVVSRRVLQKKWNAD